MCNLRLVGKYPGYTTWPSTSRKSLLAASVVQVVTAISTTRPRMIIKRMLSKERRLWSVCDNAQANLSSLFTMISCLSFHAFCCAVFQSLIILLVINEGVGEPDVSSWNPYWPYIIVLIRVPEEAFVCPFLRNNRTQLKYISRVTHTISVRLTNNTKKPHVVINGWTEGNVINGGNCY